LTAAREGLSVRREGAIAFDKVTFHYGEGNPVIENLTLSIRPGEKIGLVGPSGAGKSTLVNLLLRFYPLHEGRILIDGQDIAEVTQDSLRAAIGMVTQDTSLLHRSVRDNILYGRPEADDEAIEEVARAARADSFVADLVDPRGGADMRPMSASAGSSFPAANGSGSPSPASS
jgi:ATP-binding cassette subfamily B multidrug efflux pump